MVLDERGSTPPIESAEEVTTNYSILRKNPRRDPSYNVSGSLAKGKSGFNFCGIIGCISDAYGAVFSHVVDVWVLLVDDGGRGGDRCSFDGRVLAVVAAIPNGAFSRGVPHGIGGAGCPARRVSGFI